jgi:hypothetical protein
MSKEETDNIDDSYEGNTDCKLPTKPSPKRKQQVKASPRRSLAGGTFLRQEKKSFSSPRIVSKENTKNPILISWTQYGNLRNILLGKL